MKFCPTCGAQLADDAEFCGTCGTKMPAANPATAPAPNQGQSAPNPGVPNMAPVGAAPKKNNMGLIIGIAAGAVALIVILIIAFMSLGGSYKKTVKTLVKLYNSECKDPAKFDELYMPKSIVSSWDSTVQTFKPVFEDKDDFEDFTESMNMFSSISEDYLDDLYDDWEDEYGKDWKITYEIKDVDKIDKDDLEDYSDELSDLGDEYELDEDDVEDLMEALEYSYDIDYSDSDCKKISKAFNSFVKDCSKVKASAGYEVEVVYKIKGKDGHGKYEADYEIIKMGGKWYIDSVKFYFN